MERAWPLAAAAGLSVAMVAGCGGTLQSPPQHAASTPAPAQEQIHTYQVPQHELDFLDQIAPGFASSSIAGDERHRSATVEYAYTLCPLIREHGSAAVAESLLEQMQTSAYRSFNAQMPSLLTHSAEALLC